MSNDLFVCIYPWKGDITSSGTKETSRICLHLGDRVKVFGSSGGWANVSLICRNQKVSQTSLISGAHRIRMNIALVSRTV